MKIGGVCIDWKIVASLAAVAVGILVLYPRYFVAALPVLLLAACPLSMIAMMFAMRGMGGQSSQRATPAVPGTTRDAAPPEAGLVQLQQQVSEVEGQNAELTDKVRRLERMIQESAGQPAETSPQGPKL